MMFNFVLPPITIYEDSIFDGDKPENYKSPNWLLDNCISSGTKAFESSLPYAKKEVPFQKTIRKSQSVSRETFLPDTAPNQTYAHFPKNQTRLFSFSPEKLENERMLEIKKKLFVFYKIQALPATPNAKNFESSPKEIEVFVPDENYVAQAIAEENINTLKIISKLISQNIGHYTKMGLMDANLWSKYSNIEGRLSSLIPIVKKKLFQDKATPLSTVSKSIASKTNIKMPKEGVERVERNFTENKQTQDKKLKSKPADFSSKLEAELLLLPHSIEQSTWPTLPRPNRFNPLNDDLLTSAKNGDYARVSTLLKKVSPNIKDKLGQTPMHLAAFGGHIMIMGALLKEHAYKNAKTDNNETPLDYAIKANKPAVVNILLNLNAKFNFESLFKPLQEVELPLSKKVVKLNTSDTTTDVPQKILLVIPQMKTIEVLLKANVDRREIKKALDQKIQEYSTMGVLQHTWSYYSEAFEQIKEISAKKLARRS